MEKLFSHTNTEYIHTRSKQFSAKPSTLFSMRKFTAQSSQAYYKLLFEYTNFFPVFILCDIRSYGNIGKQAGGRMGG